MDLVRKIDDYGKPAWIALLVAAFVVFWPAALVLLVYLIWSRRLGSGPVRNDLPFKDVAERMKAAWDAGWRGPETSSGNAAFDAYRAETFNRLEAERRELDSFIARLRTARDQAEFDLLLAERRSTHSPV